MSSVILYTSSISKVTFGVSNSEDARINGTVVINSGEMFKNNKPLANGVFDTHLGTTDHNYDCGTCLQSKKLCTGHEGYIQLNYPLINPLLIKEVHKWLRVLCLKCGASIVPKIEYEKYDKKTRMSDISKPNRLLKPCHVCEHVNYSVRYDVNKQPLSFVVVNEKGVEKTIYPHHVKKILESICDELFTDLAKPGTTHPRNFVRTCIVVPPTSIRPDVRKITGDKSKIDPITTLLQAIIRANNDPILKDVSGDDIGPDVAMKIYEISVAYFDMIKAKGESEPNSLAFRLKGKKGRVRKTQLGKRVRNMCRSTITCNPLLKMDEVGVPMIFAKTIQIEETVQDFNRDRIMCYVANGRAGYPGCTNMIKVTTGTEHVIDNIKDIELMNGDRVFRDLISGDPVYFNRQPSLQMSNITTMRAVVCEDPSVLTLQMNVDICPLFGADFDGDLTYQLINVLSGLWSQSL